MRVTAPPFYMCILAITIWLKEIYEKVWVHYNYILGQLFLLERISCDTIPVLFVCSVSHMTPTSLSWLQWVCPQPLWGHMVMDGSLPRHFTFSIQMCPVPWPNTSQHGTTIAAPLKPNSLHTTWAALMSNWFSQIVPHLLSFPMPWWTSTRPADVMFDPTNRSAVWKTYLSCPNWY